MHRVLKCCIVNALVCRTVCMANGWGSRLLCLLWQKHPDRSVPPPCHWRERWWRHSSASCWSGWRCTSAMRALVCACTVVQCQLILSLLLFPLMPRRGTWVGAVMLPVFVAVIRWWFPHSWTAACERMCPGKLRWAASGLRKAVCWSNSNCASRYAARLETSFIFFPELDAFALLTASAFTCMENEPQSRC